MGTAKARLPLRGSSPVPGKPLAVQGVTCPMATLIPVEGETTECGVPYSASENDLRELLKVPAPSKGVYPLPLRRVFAADGSSWWWNSAGGMNNVVPLNPRANTFWKARGTGSTQGSYLVGTVLYLSVTETKKFFRFKTEMVPVYGRTFEIKEKLKQLNGRWDPTVQLWLVPTQYLQAANDLVVKG